MPGRFNSVATGGDVNPDGVILIVEADQSIRQFTINNGENHWLRSRAVPGAGPGEDLPSPRPATSIPSSATPR
jgi:hypothetical protein